MQPESLNQNVTFKNSSLKTISEFVSIEHDTCSIVKKKVKLSLVQIPVFWFAWPLSALVLSTLLMSVFPTIL